MSAVEAFLESIGPGIVVGQVLITQHLGVFELRHVQDRSVLATDLKSLNPVELRQWAQTNASGQFRPLRSAPDLMPGWRLQANSLQDLEFALNQVYPGALADWYATRSATPPVTHYREYTQRQTGMYRITATLSDVGVAQLTRACCRSHFCLKRRYWTIPGLEPDAPKDQNLLVCLEPCAILMELARKAARLQQETPTTVALHPEDLVSIRAAIETVIASSNGAGRSADFSNPTNPRRLQLLLERLPSAPERESDE